MTILHDLRKGLRTASPEETEALGEALVADLPENAAIALSGDLGTGKTTLVRGLARGLGIDAAVTSPTYNIYTIYNGNRQLVHMDAYRLTGREALESLTIEEFLKSPFLIAVEWPENIPGFFEDYPTLRIRLDLMPDRLHEIRLID